MKKENYIRPIVSIRSLGSGQGYLLTSVPGKSAVSIEDMVDVEYNW